MMKKSKYNINDVLIVTNTGYGFLCNEHVTVLNPNKKRDHRKNYVIEVSAVSRQFSGMIPTNHVKYDK